MLMLMVIVSGSFLPEIFCTGSSGYRENASTLIWSQINSSETKSVIVTDSGNMIYGSFINGYHTNQNEKVRNKLCFKSQEIDETTCRATHVICYDNTWRKESIYREFTVFERSIFNLILTLVTIVYVFTFSRKSFPIDGDIKYKTEKGDYKVHSGFYMDVPRQIIVRMLTSFDTGAKPKALTRDIHVDRHGDDGTDEHSGNSTDENQASGYLGDISNSINRYENVRDQKCNNGEQRKVKFNVIDSRNETKASHNCVRKTKSGSSERTNDIIRVNAGGDSKRNAVEENAASSIQCQNKKLEKVDNPKYRDICARHQTFENWPRSNAGNISDISDAGFYYIGFEDSVRCFSCGGGYYHFKPTTNPYSEHLRLYPSCRFINQKIEERNNESDANGVNVGTATQASDDHEPRSTDEETISLPEVKVTKSALSHTDIKNLLEIGFKKKEIEDFICRQLSNGDNEETTDPILQHLMSKQPENHVEKNDVKDKSPALTAEGIGNDEAMSPSGYITTTEVRNRRENQNQVANASETSDPSSDEEAVQSMRNENRQLREHLLCKICLDNDSSVVFLNCGHMVSCPECSPAIRKCPICRKRIRGRVQIQ